MKSIRIRNWKTLKRHPLSAQYPDLKGEAAEAMRESVRRYGVVDRNVKLYEGQVLDGWQLYTACVAEGVKPEFQHLPKGIDPEDYAELMNDTRRHETPEMVLARIAERRKRVAAAREEGKSLRTIAEEEGVNERTVRNDLEKVSTAEGSAVEPKDGKIKGL